MTDALSKLDGTVQQLQQVVSKLQDSITRLELLEKVVGSRPDAPKEQPKPATGAPPPAAPPAGAQAPSQSQWKFVFALLRQKGEENPQEAIGRICQELGLNRRALTRKHLSQMIDHLKNNG